MILARQAQRGFLRIRATGGEKGPDQTAWKARTKLFAQPRFWPGLSVAAMVLFKTLLEVRIPGGLVYEYLSGALRSFMILNLLVLIFLLFATNQLIRVVRIPNRFLGMCVLVLIGHFLRVYRDYKERQRLARIRPPPATSFTSHLDERKNDLTKQQKRQIREQRQGRNGADMKSKPHGQKDE